MPKERSTPEVGQQVAPQWGIVYVDDDPIVLADARKLPSSIPPDAYAYM